MFYLEKGCSCGQQIWLVDLLPSWKDGEWLKCSPRCFDLNHNLLELLSSVAISPLIHCSSGLSLEMLLDRSTNQFIDRWSHKKRVFLPDPSSWGFGKPLNVIQSVTMMGECQVNHQNLWKINEWSLWLHFVALMFKLTILSKDSQFFSSVSVQLS